jgi:hypothetical protein
MEVVEINFDNTYELLATASNLREATFNSYDKVGNPVLLKILIDPTHYPLLPNVYNLCFGPLKDDGTIDDMAQISHQNLNKVFSTIIFFSLTFLQENPNITIGLDGSDDVRAYLYHRMFRSNKASLDEYFVALGADWFVRLLRNDDYERNADGSAFFKPRPEPFDYQRPARDLYRYYMFYLRNNNM